MNWPSFFLPRPGQEQPPTSNLLLLPQNLIDAFYFYDLDIGSADLIAVLACLGGDLEIVPSSAFETLSGEVRSQLQTIQVSQRNKFRMITARKLYVFSLEAVEQHAHAVGFNDALHLFGRMQAKLSTDSGSVRLTPLANEGRLNVGRLDLLNAFRASLPHVFLHPYTPNEKMYQLVLPVAPSQEVAQGQGVALVYPLVDTEVAHTLDNSVIVMRIVYDVLLRLQQDMAQEGVKHRFTTLNIPVPSRRRLEQELALDNYIVEGDVAIKQSGQAVGQASGQVTFLERLRRLAERWSAPKITLPPQATPQIYRDLIDEVWPNVAKSEDVAIAQAIARLTSAPGLLGPKPAASPIVQPLPVSPSTPLVIRQPSPQRSSSKRPKAADRDSWVDDFATSAAPIKPGRRNKNWWEDFEMEHIGPPLQSRQITATDDWLTDLLAEQDRKTVTPPASSAPSFSPQDDWSKDFDTPDVSGKSGSKQSTDDWAKDFE